MKSEIVKLTTYPYFNPGLQDGNNWQVGVLVAMKDGDVLCYEYGCWHKLPSIPNAEVGRRAEWSMRRVELN